MEHLTLEALARLVDEPPTPEEERHLSSCGECRAELSALREQKRVLADLPAARFEAADLGWDALSAALRSEGLLRDSTGVPARSASAPAWMRIAASLLLLALGGAAGWGIRGAASPTPGGDMASREVGGARVENSARTEDQGEGTPQAGVEERFAMTTVESTGPTMGAAPPHPISESPAAAPDLLSLLFALPAEATTLEEAEAVVRVAEIFYGDALTTYRGHLERAGEAPSEDLVGRYMALGNVIAITEEAVRTAPADPFLNSLLITTVVERDAVEQGMTRIAAGQ